MMTELGTLIDRSETHLHTQAPQMSAGKAFRNRLASGATIAMNQLRRRGEEAEAVDVVIESFRADGYMMMLTFNDLWGVVTE